MSLCEVRLLECGHTDCPTHHRCDCIQRAGCLERSAPFDDFDTPRGEVGLRSGLQYYSDDDS